MKIQKIEIKKEFWKVACKKVIWWIRVENCVLSYSELCENQNLKETKALIIFIWHFLKMLNLSTENWFLIKRLEESASKTKHNCLFFQFF
jgi:hypothetical protein